MEQRLLSGMGSLVGAFAPFVTTCANQHYQYRCDFLSKQFAQRETLYSEFINEAARLKVESLDSQMQKASGLVTMTALARNATHGGASPRAISGVPPESSVWRVAEHHTRAPQTLCHVSAIWKFT